MATNERTRPAARNRESIIRCNGNATKVYHAGALSPCSSVQGAIMRTIDKQAIVNEVRRLLPEVETIALTGSAAHGAKNFTADSDIDIVAINPRACMACTVLDGHEVVIGAVLKKSVAILVENPQWFNPGWAFRVGMIAQAEVLFGEPLEPTIRSLINERTWLVAATGLVGLLILAQKKALSGRRPHFNESIIDIPIVITALRHVVARSFPIRCEPDADVAALGPLSEFAPELQRAATLAVQYRDILAEDQQVAKLSSSLPQRLGVEWMRKALQINRPMPNISQ
jgi:predicted nucleotidyltransferase